MRRLVLTLPLLLLTAGAALAQSAPAYDASWYKGEFWSGEYPAGFSVLADTTVMLRPALDPAAEKTIACDLPAKATYHPWNAARTLEDGLRFVSFTRKQEYKLTAPYELTGSDTEGNSVAIPLKAGDHWTYLAYYGEGAFAMEFDGVQYEAGQDLIDISTPLGTAEGYDEWLRINCAGNRWGWLYLPEISQDDKSFSGPNITTYGAAADLE